MGLTKIRGLEYKEFEPNQHCMWQPLSSLYIGMDRWLPGIGVMFRYTVDEDVYTFPMNVFWLSLLNELAFNNTIVHWMDKGKMEVCI